MNELAQETSLAQARLHRMKLRSTVENLPIPLADTPAAVFIMEQMPGHAWQCVDEPSVGGVRSFANDAADDGPALARDAGCTAQRMFTRGDFAALDAKMKYELTHLSDLPDGSSRLEGTWTGLSNLFSYGKITVEEGLRRTAEWRRSVKGSVEPELVEALLFREWAYGARGRGYASTVSPEAMQVFFSRSAMAGAGLSEIAASAAGNPLWYQLVIGGRPRSVRHGRKAARDL